MSPIEQKTRITELFSLLIKGHKWLELHEHETERCEALIERSGKIFDELESIGVDRTFSCCVLVFGPKISHELVNGFVKKI